VLADFAYVVITENLDEEKRAEFEGSLHDAIQGRQGDDGRAARREAAARLS
jgi:hypothetical protein